jgi:hypothetical protein
MTLHHLMFLLIGVVIGLLLGVGLMAIMIAGAEADERIRRINKQ